MEMDTTNYSLSDEHIPMLSLTISSSGDAEINACECVTCTLCEICVSRCVDDTILVGHHCGGKICQQCFDQHIETTIMQGRVIVHCPMCWRVMDDAVSRVSSSFPEDIAAILEHNLVESRRDTGVKTCPNCRHVTQVNPDSWPRMKPPKDGVRVECIDCTFEWCFVCHAPWHEGLSCKKWQGKGAKQLTRWANGVIKRRAKKCPHCQTYVEKVGNDCDEIWCRCGCMFCFSCGKAIITGQENNDPSVCQCRSLFVCRRMDVALWVGMLTAAILLLPITLIVGSVWFLKRKCWRRHSSR